MRALHHPLRGRRTVMMNCSNLVYLHYTFVFYDGTIYCIESAKCLSSWLLVYLGMWVVFGAAVAHER